MDASAITAELTSKGVAFTTHEHPAVVTAEEQEVHIGGLGGAHIKSLLVSDKKHGAPLTACSDCLAECLP
jgi:hypothetical protein